ncbi:MAG: sigma-54-dependent Fis family transcriptional regulator [Candidatus Binataceae bacterium]
MTNLAEDATFRMLYELACAFASRIELDELIPFVIDRCRAILRAEGVSVLLLDPERSELYFPYVSQSDPEVAARVAALRFPADRGIAGAALSSGEPQKVDNVQLDPRFYAGIDRQTGATTRSILAVPLTSPEGPLGVIEAVDLGSRAAAFSEQDLALLQALAASIAVAIFNAHRFGSLESSAQRLRIQVDALRRDFARHDRFSEIVGTSPAMREVFRLMEAAAGSAIPVLVEGQTGTGKELVARAIYRAGGRAEGPFLAVNCAALPETLLESELFGHRRGAFTGAVCDQPGLFRAAGGGVIFLDEIGEMALPMQAKLLRVIEQHEVVAVGDHRPQKVDVKVISATNRDLKAAVGARLFREDLYYRLAGFQIRIPPLRERREDIPLLAACFLKAGTERYLKHIRGFAPETLELLCGLEWPGNVRQLHNEIEGAVTLAADGEAIRPEHLSISLRMAAMLPGAARDPAGCGSAAVNGLADAPLREVRNGFEARYIGEALHRHRGNVSRAAVALSISRVALQKKIKRYGLR